MEWSEIIIHHSLTPDGGVVDTQAIRRFHTSWRVDGRIVSEADGLKMREQGERGVVAPWKDIGYHFMVERINGQPEVLLGRPLTMYGGHTVGRNKTGIGVCVVGNFDLEAPGEDVLEVLVERLLKPLCRMYRIPAGFIRPHHLYADYKTCPGLKFDMEDLRRRVRG